MIKRTLYFGNPAYLSKKDGQLLLRLPEVEKNSTIPDSFKKQAEKSIPIEDIAVVVLDHQRITISQALMAALLDNNVAIITCDDKHHPTGLMLPLCGNSIQSERFRSQIDASVPLKKNLWQQTVSAKIRNQAMLLKSYEIVHDNMIYWANSVKSGDAENHEGRAAAYYWKSLTQILGSENPLFLRDRFGEAPNNLLNYGYSILRATVARGLVSSGLLPTLGIFHKNKYNAYCLADDIMEPYRPFVDKLVIEIIETEENFQELSKAIKAKLLGISTADITINGERSPLMVGLQKTTASLVRCFEGVQKKIAYPELPGTELLAIAAERKEKYQTI
ncbi:MAG: type II CRISPR-associated endonuclease Cas1 [Bacteroidetes bacterium]|nr:type II CRISPR-associated endonuclease Cas1 [Bacteroidota bacterium]